MPWRVIVCPDHPIVETSYSGLLTPSELTSAVHETLAAAEQEGVNRLLADCTTLEGGHSVVDLYTLAKEVAERGIMWTIREAVLLPRRPDAGEKVRFWETTCINRGFTVRLFDDRQAALDWLLE